MTPPLVSAIVLSLNRRSELRDALSSLLSQDYSPLEILVLDNGSTDGSPDMVSSEFPSVRLTVLRENVGACLGRNLALKQAEGDYVFQMDNDATLFPSTALSLMVARFDAEPDLGIIFTRIEDPSTGRPYRPGYGTSYVDDEFYTWRFHGCAAMIRRRAIDAAGYYLPDEFFRAAEENDLAVRTLDAGFNILYLPSVTAHHKLSPKSRDASSITFLTVRNNLRVAWKFYPIPRAFLLTVWRPLHFLLTRLAAGDLRAVPAFFKILCGQSDALKRRRPVRPSTMRLIDALTLRPALTLDEMRALRSNPPSTSHWALLRKRLTGGAP